MKKTILLVLLIILSACKTNLKREQELELKVQELELTILQLKENYKTNNPNPESFGNAIITGSGVSFRQGHTTKSAKKGRFQKNEKILILDEKVTANTNEASTKQSILFTKDENNFKVSKGKSLKILLRDGDNFKVEFLHPTYGKMEAIVKKSKLQLIEKKTWFKVKRSSGKIGWVFGQYVKKQ